MDDKHDVKKILDALNFYALSAETALESKWLQAASEKIKELLRIGAKMHTWIFLHTTDEQAAYDEIGLTAEQNAMFGYSGQMILKAAPPKGVE